MPSPKYKVSLKLSDNTFTASGLTIVEALEKLVFETPAFIKSKGILTAHFKKLKAELLLPLPVVKRLKVNPLARQLMEKRLQMAFK